MKLKAFLRAGLCAALMSPAAATGVSAQELDSNTGDIIVVGFNFCPQGWIEANGALLPVAQYEPLFALYGVQYGGDGRTTFAVPDFRGRAIIHQGQAGGATFRNPNARGRARGRQNAEDALTNMPIGTRGGQWAQTLSAANLVPHTHAAIGSSGANNVPSPDNAAFADYTNAPLSGYNAPADTAMEADVISNTGGNQSFMTMAPSTVLLACVQPNGIFPTRN